MRNANPTADIDSNVWSMLEKMIDRNNEKGISAALSFLRSVIRKSVQYKKLDNFRQYITFFQRMYMRVLLKHKHNPSAYDQLYRGYADYMALHIREIIWFDITIQGKKATSLEDRKKINEFYYQAFLAYNNLFFAIIRNQDWLTFQKAIAYFNDLNEGAYGSNIGLKIEIEQLKRSNIDGINDKKVNLFAEQLIVNEQHNVYKRHVLSGLKYWLYFLYSENQIDVERLINTINSINQYTYNPNEEVKDILFFRGNTGGYMGWDHWDNVDRESGIMYSPPMPYKWMTMGFFIDRVRNGIYYFETEKADSKNLDNLADLYNSLEEISTGIKSIYHKWEALLKTDIESFNEKVKLTLAPFEAARRLSVGNRESIIAEATLNQDRILQVKNEIGKAWQQYVGLRQVFELYGNKEEIPLEGKKLKSVGQRTFLEKGKVMFIDGQYYSKIYGIERLGSNVSRWEDDLFFEVMLKSPNVEILQEKKIVQVLDKSIQSLRDKGIVPSLIIMEPEYAYKDEEFLNSEKYIANYKLPENKQVPFSNIGTYDNIIIAVSYSRYIKNKVIVCEFEKAVSMLFKTKPGAYNDLLVVDVKEVDDITAKERLSSEPQKWKETENGSISEPEALTLIKTSVILDIETILDFNILDSSKMILGSVSAPIND